MFAPAQQLVPQFGKLLEVLESATVTVDTGQGSADVQGMQSRIDLVALRRSQNHRFYPKRQVGVAGQDVAGQHAQRVGWPQVLGQAEQGRLAVERTFQC